MWLKTNKKRCVVKLVDESVLSFSQSLKESAIAFSFGNLYSCSHPLRDPTIHTDSRRVNHELTVPGVRGAEVSGE